MTQTSKKLRGHIGLGLSVCDWVGLSVTLAYGQERLKDRILKFNMWNKHEKLRGPVFFFSSFSFSSELLF